MALYGENRDVLLINSINRELLNNIITQQVGYYKYILGKNKPNLYGETLTKYLTDPVLINCLIARTDQRWGTVDGLLDTDRDLDFAFLRQDLVDISLVPEIGDVILYHNNYFEVTGLIENQLFLGKKPEYSYSDGLSRYGSSISIICKGKLKPADQLGISIER